MMSANLFSQMATTLTVTLKKRPAVNRLIRSRAEITESETWDIAVARLLGPIVTEADREKRRSDALALAAAAMRAAGEKHGEASLRA